MEVRIRSILIKLFVEARQDNALKQKGHDQAIYEELWSFKEYLKTVCSFMVEDIWENFLIYSQSLGKNKIVNLVKESR